MLEIFDKLFNSSFNFNKPMTYIKIFLFFLIMSFFSNIVFKLL